MIRNFRSIAMARPTAGYSRTQILLHWAVVLLILQQYLLRDGIVAFYDAEMEAALLASMPLAVAHIAAGSLILVFVLWRLVLRQRHGVPPPPESSPAWQRLVARLTHTGIYAVLILLPVSGLLTWAQLSQVSDIASEAHEMLQTVLLGLIALHVAGAFYGQFVRKTDVIVRMLRPVP
jgi:cytochrome b561